MLICILFILGFLYAPYINRLYIKDQHINVYTWADMFDLGCIHEFEKNTGIKVNLIYYDACEELITKLQITKGRSCDALLLADCVVPELIKLDMITKIDKLKLNFWQELEPKLLNKSYDLANNYTVPYSWDIYGIGINLSKFNNQLPIKSWGLIFEHDLGAINIGMVEDGLSSVNIAAQYLYKTVQVLNTKQLADIKNLLIKQKKLVQAYTALRCNYLLSSGASPAVATQAACIYNIMQKNANIRFIIPQEGGFISTENFAIYKNSKKQDLVYQFINFMYQKKVVSKYISKTNFLPVRSDLLQEINCDYLGNKECLLQEINLAKIAFFDYIAPRDDIMKLWMEVKAT